MYIAVIGLVPLGLMSYVTLDGVNRLAAQAPKRLQNEAINVLEALDRLLAERYRDVQVLAQNAIFLREDLWRPEGGKTNLLIEELNAYVAISQVNRLTMLVSPEGKLLGVNNLDAQGKPLTVEKLYDYDFSKAPWLKDAVKGNFLVKAAHGAVISHVSREEVLKIASGGGEIKTVGFSSPVKDETGKVVAVVHNLMDLKAVEDLTQQLWQELAHQGLGTTVIRVASPVGGLISWGRDPVLAEQTDRETKARQEARRIENERLAALGKPIPEPQGANQPWKDITRGQSGNALVYQTDRDRWEWTGYAASDGVPGFPGLDWKAVVMESEANVMADSRRLMWFATGLGSLSLVLVGITVWILRRQVVRPLMRIHQRLSAVMSDLLGSSQVMNENGVSLSRSATEQAASLEETSAASEQLSNTTKQNAEHAQRAQDQVQEESRRMDRAGQTLGQLSESMDRLAQSGNRTQKIVRTINEIAFQTNLLALNAAVEAARAGSAGAGFAVVADEVRSLANRAAAAASETSQLIEGSLHDIERGVQLTRQTSGEFEQMRLGLEAAAKEVVQIAQSSRDQAGGFQQISGALAELDGTTQQNAAVAEQTSSSAQELHNQAQELNQTVLSLQMLITGGRQLELGLEGTVPQPKSQVRRKRTHTESQAMAHSTH